MAYPASVKPCHVREGVVISWPQVWHRRTVSTGDTFVNRLLLDDHIADLIAARDALDAAPVADAAGLVQPAHAPHMPPVAPIPLAVLLELWAPDDVVTLAEPEVVVERVAGAYTAGSGV